MLALVPLGAACAGDDSTGATLPGGTVAPEAVEWCAVTDELRALGDTPVSTDPAELERTWNRAADLVARTREAAPDEIADAVREVTSGFERVRDALEQAGWDPDAVDFDALEEEIGDQDELNEQINAYTEEQCGEAG